MFLVKVYFSFCFVMSNVRTNVPKVLTNKKMKHFPLDLKKLTCRQWKLVIKRKIVLLLRTFGTFVITFHIFYLWRYLTYTPRSFMLIEISFGITVMHLPWMAHRFTLLNRLPTYTSVASCRTRRAIAWNLRSLISVEDLTNGNFLIRNEVDFFNFFTISHKATMAGQYLLLPPFPWLSGLPSPSAVFSSFLGPCTPTQHLLPIFVSHTYYFLFIYLMILTIFSGIFTSLQHIQ